MKCKVLLFISLIIYCANNHIVERAVSEYFPYQEGNWWCFLGDGETLLVDIEPLDTLLQRECFPVSFGGNVKYLSLSDRAVDEYIKIIYNVAGDDYTIIEDFIMRIELPMVCGNTYQDSLIDSLNIFGQWVKAKYCIRGTISQYKKLDLPGYSDTLYSDAGYKIELAIIYHLSSQDTLIADTTYREEYYLPEIGLVHFKDKERWYSLIEYNIQ